MAPGGTGPRPGTSRPAGRPGGAAEPATGGYPSGMATKAKSGPGRAQSKGRSTRGRTTARQPAPNDRYTPPIPKKVRRSPPWVGGLIVGLFVLGMLIVILNYTNVFPGGVSNWWLVGAIGSIFAGLMVATRYH